jgi:hypothetical protein
MGDHRLGTRIPTATAQTSSPDPSRSGPHVTYTAMVSPAPPSPSPTGPDQSQEIERSRRKVAHHATDTVGAGEAERLRGLLLAQRSRSDWLSAHPEVLAYLDHLARGLVRSAGECVPARATRPGRCAGPRAGRYLATPPLVTRPSIAATTSTRPDQRPPPARRIFGYLGLRCLTGRSCPIRPRR